MIFHGLFRDEHLFGDFFVLITLRDQHNDFAFALAKLSALAVGLPVGVWGGKIRRGSKLPDDRSGGIGVEPNFARMHLLNALFDEAGVCAFEEDTGAAQLHGLDELLFIIGASEKNDLRSGRTCLYIAKYREAVDSGQSWIQEHYIGIELNNFFNGLNSVRGFPQDV